MSDSSVDMQMMMQMMLQMQQTIASMQRGTASTSPSTSSRGGSTCSTAITHLGLKEWVADIEGIVRTGKFSIAGKGDTVSKIIFLIYRIICANLENADEVTLAFVEEKAKEKDYDAMMAKYVTSSGALTEQGIAACVSSMFDESDKTTFKAIQVNIGGNSVPLLDIIESVKNSSPADNKNLFDALISQFPPSSVSPSSSPKGRSKSVRPSVAIHVVNRSAPASTSTSTPASSRSGFTMLTGRK